MAEFDIVSKQLFKNYPTDFVQFTLNRKRLQVLEVIDTELPTVESRHADSLARVKIGGREVLVHTEFQTEDSTTTPMPRRMAGYIGRLVESFGLPVHASVIYLRPNAGRNDYGKYEHRIGDSRLTVSYRVIRLIEINGEQIIQRKLWGLLPFSPLMQPPEGTLSANWLRQCVQTADELPLDESNKGDFMTSIAILGGLAYNPEAIFNIISEETMFESTVVQRLAEGLTERAQRTERIESVLDLVNRRFCPDNTDGIKTVLDSVEDLDLLRKIFYQAIDAPSFDEFQKALETAIRS